ncbi:peptidoglycan D,D-transpeptidase FtsI family protein [Paenibacillus lentus]|uniref:Penicillin-binding protein 2 n=1 Tax=Paenibacillus lentus TaxID=1338368 RepID=A0A3Q8SAR2_9BACL|nr:penicillin-binding protein 2 [Paenibacillus lentus]AZK46243.1 penicillin-binding protein 2 [Paenibacillus lentus]
MRKLYSGDLRKQEAELQRHFNIRLNLFFFISFAIFTVIIVRLAILQFVEGPTLAQRGIELKVRDIPFSPIRGTIYAARGEKLAYSTSVQSLYITLQKDYSKNTDKGTENRPEAVAFAESLKTVFDIYGDPNVVTMTLDEIIDAMDLEYRKAGGFAPRRIKIGLTELEIAYFVERKDQFPGIDIVEESIRHYDEDRVAVQMIGYLRKYSSTLEEPWYATVREWMASDDKNPGLEYTQEEFVGFDGLEMQYQHELRGKNGYKSVPINPRNMASGIPELTAPEKGYDLHTTIDKKVQLAAQKAITDQLEWLHNNRVSGRLHPHAKTGYAVAMEVETGNIVAMASMPDYDTNIWQTGSLTIEQYERIKTNYRNGAITPYSSGRSGHNFDSTVLLGSTIKPLSVLIGLNEGLFTTNDTYQDRGIAYFGKNNSSSVRNSGRFAYGGMDPSRAIYKSSNAFMVDMVGERLYNKHRAEGIDVWDKYMKEFGLGISTGIDLPNEFHGILDYRDDRETPLARLVYASFGQQARYTTLQLAQYTATLANRGKRMEPHLVSKITTADGDVVKEFKPKVLNEVSFKKEHWNEVISGMKTDVSAFHGFPYDFARKTGTSEQDYKGTMMDNGVFIAFAPRESPKLAVAVVVPEGGFGSMSAAPIARKIFDAYDQEYGLAGVAKRQNLQN